MSTSLWWAATQHVYIFYLTLAFKKKQQRNVFRNVCDKRSYSVMHEGGGDLD